MLSVIGFNLARIEEMIGGRPNVYIANHLSELQIVIAGYMDDLKALETVFNDGGAKMVTLLDMRGPSHAPLLDKAADAFAEVLSSADMQPMQKTVYANVLGKPYESGSDVRQLLAAQMRSRVRWHDCSEHMIASGIACFVEVGPSNVLSKLMKRRVGRGGAITASVRDVPTLEKLIEQLRGGANE
jgi:[acyl-carrier-protein] S-malonyltransferase